MVSAKQRDSCFQKVVFLNVILLLISLIVHALHTMIIKKNIFKQEKPNWNMNPLEMNWIWSDLKTKSQKAVYISSFASFRIHRTFNSIL